MTVQLTRRLSRRGFQRGTHSTTQEKAVSWRAAAACCYLAEMKGVRQGLRVQDSAVSGELVGLTCRAWHCTKPGDF